MQLEHMEFFGKKIFFRPNTPDEGVIRAAVSEDLLVAVRLLSQATANKVILDLGGYIGTTSVFFSNAITNATILAVEPSPDNYQVMKLNTLRYKNIIPINAAVGSQRMKGNIYDRHTGEWGHTLCAQPEDCENPDLIAQVDVLTVADIQTIYSPKDSFPALVKIDIEGYEAELLQASSWLHDWPVIIIELHERIRAGCVDLWNSFLHSSNYVEIYVDHEKRVCADADALVRLLRQPGPS